METSAPALRRAIQIAITLAALAGAMLLIAASPQDAVAKPKKPKTHSKRVLVGPKGLKFYKPPKHIPGRHGKLIWARKANGLVPLADAKYTKNVLYSSTTPQGLRTAVSGSVSVPKGKPPKGGWPVITYAHGTTGIADACAPSRNQAGGVVQSLVSYMDPDLNEWLRAGYAVLRTDYQGLGTPGKHPYLVGEAEGRSVLDIVLAAHRLDRKISRQFLIAGHSQGGHAALFAAGEAASWTPNLTLHGTVAFAPASHILEQVPLLAALTTPNSLTALATMILDGASTVSSQVNVNQLLSDPVLAFYPLLDQQCLSQLGASNELGGIAPSTLIRSGADLSPVNPVLASMNPAVSTAAPILLAQGASDTTVIPAFTTQLKGELGGLGDQVTLLSYPGVTHGGVVTSAESDALAFFRQNLPPPR